MPSFFVIGSARSGTTLLRVLLNAHPRVAVPPESRFVVELWRGAENVDVKSFLDDLALHPQFGAWELPIDAVARELLPSGRVPYAEAIDAVYRAYARVRGKDHWGDKTPRYIEHIPLLAHLFPEARFVHIVRDGRNVALSYAETPFGPKTIARAAELWARRVRTGQTAGRALAPERYLEMRYEDLVAHEGNLEEHARELCDFLGLEFDPAMLSYGETGEVLDKAKTLNPLVTGRPVAATRSWQQQMPRVHVEVFELLAGDLLSELGYERWFPHPGTRARIVAELGLRRVPVGRLRGTRRATS